MHDTPKITYKLGDKVEGNFRGNNKWKLGRIYKCNPDKTYHISYDDGDHEEFIAAPKLRKFVKASKSTVALVAKLSIKGTKVRANFRGKGLWYPGSISRVHKDETLNVDYDDGEEEAFVDATNVQLATDVAPAAGHVYKEGYIVNANYYDRGTYYQARICFAHADGTYDVIYSNGLTEYRKAESSLFAAYTSLTWKWDGTYDVVFLDGRCVNGYPSECVIRKSSTDYQILIMVMVLIAIVVLIIAQGAKILYMVDEL